MPAVGPDEIDPISEPMLDKLATAAPQITLSGADVTRTNTCTAVAVSAPKNLYGFT